MQEERDRRDVVADGVFRGYSEAMVSAKAWKGRMGHRPWREAPKGLTGAALEAAVDALSLRFPEQVH